MFVNKQIQMSPINRAYFLCILAAFALVFVQCFDNTDHGFKDELDILPEMLKTSELSFKINGPRSKHDKIAIVGAGPAGIHMAYMLKMNGYTNLHILEKTNRIGGKSQSIPHRGVNHDIGTVYLSPDYQNNIIPLINRYLPNQLVFFPSASIWLDQKLNPITYAEYLLTFAGGIFKERNATVIGMKVIEEIIRYNQIHESIFGKYEGEIMPEPTQEKKSLITGTYMDFLVRNNLTILLPILHASTTAQGYGNLDEISALYGLMWNTPIMMFGFIGRIRGNVEASGFMVVKTGFQKLWETIVDVENLPVTFNVDILRVYRTLADKCKTTWIYKSDSGSTPSWECFDFLIWSPEMSSSMSTWHNEVPEERDLLGSTVPTYFTVSIIDNENAIRGLTPINYWMDNIANKRWDNVSVERDTFGTYSEFQGPSYQNRTYPISKDGSNITTSVVYQMSKSLKSKEYLNKVMMDNFQPTSTPKIIHSKTWRYFPRYSVEDMEDGRLWRILEIQGKYGMWYIGSSVCFESVKSVVEYNKLIIKNMI